MEPAAGQDVNNIAAALPDVERTGEPALPTYRVHGKPFLLFRAPRPDAVDECGERLTDVVVIWVPSASDKLALIGGDGPFFTTPHFVGHNSVLLRLANIGQLSRQELTEIITDAWLSRAPKRIAARWLEQNS